MISFLEFAFAGFWRFCGVVVMVCVVGFWIAAIVDAFTPFYGIGIGRRLKKKVISYLVEELKNKEAKQ